MFIRKINCYSSKSSNFQLKNKTLVFTNFLGKDICEKLKTYDGKKIIEEWKKNAVLDIKITKRDDESGKAYKPLDIYLNVKLKVIKHQFPYIIKI